MPSTIQPNEAKVGDFIKFTVLDDATITYSGTVIGIANYSVAKSLGSDIAARHENVRAALTASGSSDIANVIDQNFLVVDVGSTMPQVIAFEWISDNKVELIELGSTYTIKLLNCSKEKAEEAVAILRANGIGCKLNILY